MDRDETRSGPPYRLLVTVGDACRMLSVSRSALYDLMGNRTLAYVQIGRSRRLEIAELERFVRAMGRGK